MAKTPSVDASRSEQTDSAGHGTDSDERRRGRHDIPADIIAATRKNFLHYGVNRTTMSDIARAVGMPRQTLYGFVSSRDDLVDAVLVRRIEEIAEELKPLGTGLDAFDEAFIETSVAAVERARDDPELMNILATGPADRVQDVVTGDYPEIHAIVANLLGPILDRGEEAGLLRTDKSRDEIVDWIRVAYLTLINQPAGGANRVRALVTDFLVPSIMFSRKDRAAQR